MVIKAKKGFYDDFSKKELQNMCKVYGLPANKSHSELEKSLLAYLEKVSHSRSKGRGIYQKKTIQKLSNEKISSFSRDDMVGFSPCNREKYGGKGNLGISLASPVESSSKPHLPPFEFHVRSEEGISLFVDLNSSPSDWTDKLKNEVRIFENVHTNSLRSLHEDLVCLKESSTEITNPSSPNSLIEKPDESKLDSLEKGELPLTPLVPQTYCISLDESERSKEDWPPKECGLNSNSQDHIADKAVNCESRPLDHSTLEHTSGAALSGCQNSNLLNDSSLQNCAVDPGCSERSSVDMQSSEVASCNKDVSFVNFENGGPIGGVDFDPKNDMGYEKSGLTNSSESNVEVLQEHLLGPAEEGERSKIVNERESSECSQFTEASEKTCDNPDKLSMKEGPQRKKRHVKRENRSGYVLTNTKFLRSMKRITRSKRLLSK